MSDLFWLTDTQMPRSEPPLTAVKYAYEMGTSELHRTSIMLPATAQTTNRSKYPKDLNLKAATVSRTDMTRVHSIVLAAQLLYANTVDTDGPVAEVQTLAHSTPG